MPVTNATKNIKVNIPATASTKRSSTTLSYVVCDYYFGDLLNPTSKSKFSKTGKYRSWLESTVQAWVYGIEGAQVSTSYLERSILDLIRDHCYRAGLDKNKDNLGLDI